MGGVTCFTFHKDDNVTATPLGISMDTMFDLEDNLLLFFTGFSRSASGILKDQQVKSQQNDTEMLKNLHYVKDLGYRSRDALMDGKTALFGELMHEHWEHKKRRSGGMSNPKIDEWYELGMKNGAVGGKLVGAGGGPCDLIARIVRIAHITIEREGGEDSGGRDGLVGDWLDHRPVGAAGQHHEIVALGGGAPMSIAGHHRDWVAAQQAGRGRPSNQAGLRVNRHARRLLGQ